MRKRRELNYEQELARRKQEIDPHLHVLYDSGIMRLEADGTWAPNGEFITGNLDRVKEILEPLQVLPAFVLGPEQSQLMQWAESYGRQHQVERDQVQRNFFSEIRNFFSPHPHLEIEAPLRPLTLATGESSERSTTEVFYEQGVFTRVEGKPTLVEEKLEGRDLTHLMDEAFVMDEVPERRLLLDYIRAQGGRPSTPARLQAGSAPPSFPQLIGSGETTGGFGDEDSGRSIGGKSSVYHVAVVRDTTGEIVPPETQVEARNALLPPPPDAAITISFEESDLAGLIPPSVISALEEANGMTGKTSEQKESVWDNKGGTGGTLLSRSETNDQVEMLGNGSPGKILSGGGSGVHRGVDGRITTGDVTGSIPPSRSARSSSDGFSGERTPMPRSAKPRSPSGISSIPPPELAASTHDDLERVFAGMEGGLEQEVVIREPPKERETPRMPNGLEKVDDPNFLYTQGIIVREKSSGKLVPNKEKIGNYPEGQLRDHAILLDKEDPARKLIISYLAEEKNVPVSQLLPRGKSGVRLPPPPREEKRDGAALERPLGEEEGRALPETYRYFGTLMNRLVELVGKAERTIDKNKQLVEEGKEVLTVVRSLEEVIRQSGNSNTDVLERIEGAVGKAIDLKAGRESGSGAILSQLGTIESRLQEIYQALEVNEIDVKVEGENGGLSDENVAALGEMLGKKVVGGFNVGVPKLIENLSAYLAEKERTQAGITEALIQRVAGETRAQYQSVLQEGVSVLGESVGRLEGKGEVVLGKVTGLETVLIEIKSEIDEIVSSWLTDNKLSVGRISTEVMLARRESSESQKALYGKIDESNKLLSEQEVRSRGEVANFGLVKRGMEEIKGDVNKISDQLGPLVDRVAEMYGVHVQRREVRAAEEAQRAERIVRKRAWSVGEGYGEPKNFANPNDVIPIENPFATRTVEVPSPFNPDVVYLGEPRDGGIEEEYSSIVEGGGVAFVDELPEVSANLIEPAEEAVALVDAAAKDHSGGRVVEEDSNSFSADLPSFVAPIGGDPIEGPISLEGMEYRASEVEVDPLEALPHVRYEPAEATAQVGDGEIVHEAVASGERSLEALVDTAPTDPTRDLAGGVVDLHYDAEVQASDRVEREVLPRKDSEVPELAFDDYTLERREDGTAYHSGVLPIPPREKEGVVMKTTELKGTSGNQAVPTGYPTPLASIEGLDGDGTGSRRISDDDLELPDAAPFAYSPAVVSSSKVEKSKSAVQESIENLFRENPAQPELEAALAEPAVSRLTSKYRRGNDESYSRGARDENVRLS
ncbi:MAG: hypothetical protein WC595_04105, partial [Candidatus Nanoarchaeia archaeon]